MRDSRSRSRSVSRLVKKPHLVSELPRRVARTLQIRSAMLGIGLGMARFFLTVGLLFLVAWSYSIWGSPGTPLRYLLVPGIVLIVASLLTRFILREIMIWTRRAQRIHHQRIEVQRKVRETRAIRMLEQRQSRDEDDNDTTGT